MKYPIDTISITSSDVPGITTKLEMRPIRSSFMFEKSSITIKKDQYITINNVDYCVERLSGRGNKGAHSIILKLFLCEDGERKDSHFVLKVSNAFDNWTPSQFKVNLANKSFYREIDCLRRCNEQFSNYIISIHYWGHLVCEKKNENGNNSYVLFPFYMMDCADCDLKQLFERNEIDKKEKLLICQQIASGIGELHTIGCYHRDIKPDNILLFDKEIKIGDLGLIRYRNEDTQDLFGLIGPKGWISPEAMNNFLNKERNFDSRINTEINEQSDIFQLGMVFWYIFQGNALIGCIKRTDFFDVDDMIFSLIKRMIYHSTEKRIKNISEVKNELSRILERV